MSDIDKHLDMIDPSYKMVYKKSLEFVNHVDSKDYSYSELPEDEQIKYRDSLNNYLVRIRNSIKNKANFSEFNLIISSSIATMVMWLCDLGIVEVNEARKIRYGILGGYKNTGTAPDVDEDVSQEKYINYIYSRVAYWLGINRKEPAKIEFEYVKKWLYDYDFKPNVLFYAAEIVADKKPDLPYFMYLDKVLETWLNKGLKEIGEIRESFNQQSSPKEKKPNPQNKLKRKHSDIKKCPFCGGEGIINANYSHRFDTYFVSVMCENCGSQGKAYTSNNHPEVDDWNCEICNDAINAWNMRI